jgi:hypothetical protein
MRACAIPGSANSMEKIKTTVKDCQVRAIVMPLDCVLRASTNNAPSIRFLLPVLLLIMFENNGN